MSTTTRIPIGFWTALIAVQCILSFGLIGFWSVEKNNAQDPFSQATEKTIELQFKTLTDPIAKGIIASQQMKIRSLTHARDSGYTYVGYMALLALVSLILTGLLFIFDWRARKKQMD